MLGRVQVIGSKKNNQCRDFFVRTILVFVILVKPNQSSGPQFGGGPQTGRIPDHGSPDSRPGEGGSTDREVLLELKT